MMLQYHPPGPVAAAFMQDRSTLSAIMGPMGSGKTSAVIMKAMSRAGDMKPSKIDNVRYYKLGVVRNTYTDLKRTTMKSIESWFGDQGQWGGGGSSSEPPFFKVDVGPFPDGSMANIWFEFVGLDTHNIEQLAKGWEITDYWLNEGDLLDRDVLTFVDGRAGRYPSAIHGKPDFYCGMIDYNAPDMENYLYLIFEEEKPEGYRLFKQPGGRAANAENINNLPAGYYERLCKGKEDWWIRRNVDNNYGYSRDGKPVYSEYRDDFHCSTSELMPVEGIVIKIDFDQGLHPAATLRQTMANGQVRILDELYSEKGATGLCGDLKKLLNSDKYRGFKAKGGLADPSAAKRSEDDTESWVDCVNRHMGWVGSDQLRLAETNDPDKRQAAVRNKLKTNVDDGRPGLLISSTCKVTRKGFNSDYRFKRKRVAGKPSYDENPEKKFPVSDVHDSIQYGALDDGGYEEVVGKETRKKTGFGQKTFKAKIGSVR